jgi:hypothetical protein
VLIEEDMEWMRGQLERFEAALLTEFRKCASPADLRQKSHGAALRALDVEETA